MCLIMSVGRPSFPHFTNFPMNLFLPILNHVSTCLHRRFDSFFIQLLQTSRKECVCVVKPQPGFFSSLEQFNLTSIWAPGFICFPCKPIWAPGFICFPCKPIWASGFPCKTLSFNVLSSSSQHCPSHTFQL